MECTVNSAETLTRAPLRTARTRASSRKLCQAMTLGKRPLDRPESQPPPSTPMPPGASNDASQALTSLAEFAKELTYEFFGVLIPGLVTVIGSAVAFSVSHGMACISCTSSHAVVTAAVMTAPSALLAHPWVLLCVSYVLGHALQGTAGQLFSAYYRWRGGAPGFIPFLFAPLLLVAWCLVWLISLVLRPETRNESSVGSAPTAPSKDRDVAAWLNFHISDDEPGWIGNDPNASGTDIEVSETSDSSSVWRRRFLDHLSPMSRLVYVGLSLRYFPVYPERSPTTQWHTLQSSNRQHDILALALADATGPQGWIDRMRALSALCRGMMLVCLMLPIAAFLGAASAMTADPVSAEQIFAVLGRVCAFALFCWVLFAGFEKRCRSYHLLWQSLICARWLVCERARQMTAAGATGEVSLVPFGGA